MPIAFIASLLLLLSLNATADHNQHQYKSGKKALTAYRCYDVSDRPIKGVWDQRDARLIDRVGGACVKRGPDQGDLSSLKNGQLSKRDIKKALRKARKRFPELLDGAWLVGAYNIKNSSLKHIRYNLIYDNLITGERIKVKVKQNQWSGKVKKMRARTIQRNYYS